MIDVLETKKRVSGAEHPSILIAIANLAKTYWNQGRYTEAEAVQI